MNKEDINTLLNTQMILTVECGHDDISLGKADVIAANNGATLYMARRTSGSYLAKGRDIGRVKLALEDNGYVVRMKQLP